MESEVSGDRRNSVAMFYVGAFSTRRDDPSCWDEHRIHTGIMTRRAVFVHVQSATLCAPVHRRSPSSRHFSR